MRYTKILAPAAAVLLLAGCSASPQDAYLQEVHKGVPVAKQVDDKTLVQAGRMVCQQLHLDATRYQVVAMLADDGTGFLSEPEVAVIVNAAGDHLCPEEGE
jgi:uncharacterized lipoprotein YajG